MYQRVSAYIIFLLLPLLHNSLAFALPWTMAPEVLDEARMKRLVERYRTIDTPSQLQSLLNEIERISYNKKVEAFLVDGTIQVRLLPSKPIKAVDFDLVTREFSATYDAIAYNFLGLAFSEEATLSLERQIRKMLEIRGFSKPTINIAVKEQTDSFEIEVKVDEGIPCLIQSIEWSIDIPKNVPFDVEEGQICDQKKFQKALRALEEELVEEGYKQVRLQDPIFTYDPNTNTSIVEVSGNLGRVITYEVVETGSKTYFLEDIFSTSGLNSIDPTVMTPDAVQSELVRHYRNKGYVDIVVEQPKIIQTGENEYRYIFSVTTGKQYRISNVILEGVQFFSKDKALDLLGMTSFWQGNKPLNLEEIRSGIENLKANYQLSGYWDINVREPRITKTKETGLAQIVILVSEGRQRFLREIKYEITQSEFADDIYRLSNLTEGEPVDRNQLIEFERGIRSYFLAKGFLYVDVKISLTPINVSNRIALTLKVSVKPGVRVKIGTISVKGLVRTKEKVVLRELRFETDSWYNPEDIDKSRRALLSLGLFQSVQIQQSDINAINEKTSVLDVTVTVKESKPGNVRFGPGWSLLRGGRFSIESSYNNLGGVGRQAFLRGSVSEEAQQDAIGPKTLLGRSASIGLLEPYIFDLPFSGTVSLSHLAYADDIWIFSNRGEVAVSHKFRSIIPDSILTLYYGQRINDSEGTRAQEKATVATPQTRVGFVGLRYNWDNRDNISWPTKGFYLETDSSWARYPLGGELQYFYWSSDMSVYKKINKDFVFAFGVSLASYNNIKNKNPVNDNVLPSAQLLNLEGTKIVRGFREKSLGPTVSYFTDPNDEGGETIQQDNEPGGTHRTLIRNEVRYQIYERTLATTFFVDLGTVFFTEEELDRFRTNTSYIRDNDPFDYREVLNHPEYLWKKQYASYGMSLNYLTPVGSVNLAYGLPWKRCALASGKCEVRKGKLEKHWILNGEFHINVGATF